MSYYADSSFLVSCYLPDANTSRAKSYLRSVGAFPTYPTRIAARAGHRSSYTHQLPCLPLEDGDELVRPHVAGVFCALRLGELPLG